MPVSESTPAGKHPNRAETSSCPTIKSRSVLKSRPVLNSSVTTHSQLILSLSSLSKHHSRTRSKFSGTYQKKKFIMPIESTESDVPLLQGIADYPRWARHAQAELQSQNCQEAIFRTEEPLNKEAAIQHFLSIGYARESIRTSTTMDWIEENLDKREERNAKAIGILRKLVGAQNTHLIERKSALEIWTALEARFKDPSPRSQIEAIRKACLMRMADFDSVSRYCNAYKTALNHVCGMLHAESIVNRTVAEALLQEALLANVTETYKPLIAALRQRWTPTNTDLSKACLRIESYNLALSGPKPLHTATNAPHKHQAPNGSCDFAECVKKHSTAHHKHRCWRKNPALRPKSLLEKMKPRGAKRGPNTPLRRRQPPNLVA